MGPFSVLFLGLIVVGFLAYAGYRWTEARKGELAAVAQRMGLNFDPSKRRTFHNHFGHDLFGRGHSRVAFNTITGVRRLAGHDVPVVMGDYRYVTGHGKHRKVHRLSYAIFRIPWLGTPKLVVRKEHMGDRLVGALGFDDIDFESEAFSRAFFVKSPDKRFAYDVIHPRMMEYLMRVRPPNLEIVGDACLLREGWGYWSPDRFRKMPTWFENFLELWPEHLTDTFSERTDPWI